MFPRDRVCPFHCYPYAASSVVASFPPPRYLVPSFSFPFLFQFSPPHSLSLLDATQHKKKTSMMHVLWALPYFGINWYWFNPEIRNWLIFNSISFAPKLTNCFQAHNMLVPKAHGQTSPTQATQYTPRLQQYSLVSFFPSQTSSWDARWKGSKSAGCLLSGCTCSYCKALEKITFCIFVFSRKD